MASIELILMMLLAVVVSGYVARILPAAVPLPTVQIVLGGVLAGVLHRGIVLQPAVFFLLFLAPLLFLDGWRIPKPGLLRDKSAILQLALGLVVFTVIGAGYLIHALIPAMPLAVAFALAAVVSPTDAVAVSSITSRVPVPERLMHILEGESLLNDASGLVCFQFAVAAALTGAFSLGSAVLTFLWLALGGVACGVAFTAAVAFVQQVLTRRFGEAGGSPILINLLIPFGAYLLAERLRASGILAAVAAGISMSYVELAGRSMVTTRLERTAVWNTVQFALNGIMFVLLGEQLPDILQGAVAAVHQSGHSEVWWLALYAVAFAVLLGAMRLAWVSVSLWLHTLRERRAGRQPERPGWRLILATSLAGVRGAVTLAGILALPLVTPDGAPFPGRGLAVFLAAVVILLSLVGASIGLPVLLRGLKPPSASLEQQEEDRTRAAAATAAIAAVTEEGQALQQAATADAEMVAHAASRVIAIYQRRVREGASNDAAADHLRAADAAERRLRLAGLRAERARILGLARSRAISDDTSRRLVREVDLVESLYRRTGPGGRSER